MQINGDPIGAKLFNNRFMRQCAKNNLKIHNFLDKHEKKHPFDLKF